MVQYSITDIENGIEELLRFIRDPDVYAREDQDLEIENTLQEYFEVLRDDLYLLIEYPYVDKVYRDSYYSYFASKHNDYFRDCIRVSFFQSRITESQFRTEKHRATLQKTFLGYLVIRPTFPNIVGRSLLNKNAFANNGFDICTQQGSALVNGIKLTVEGFPHSSQDAESISCAETTIWALMEYFGNRYADYKPSPPFHILQVLNRYSRMRLLPSNGLTVDQMSYALKEFGFGTYIYSREGAYGDDLENILAAYVESGIPIIAALQNDSIGHAILIIGHETESILDLDSLQRRLISYPD